MRAASVARGTQRSRTVGFDRTSSGAPNTAQRGVALELVDQAALALDDVAIDDRGRSALSRPAPPPGGGRTAASGVESDEVDEQDARSALTSPPHEASAWLSARVATSAPTWRPNRSRIPLPFAQPLRHVVEAGLEEPDLAAVVDRHVRLEVAALHLVEPACAGRAAGRQIAFVAASSVASRPATHATPARNSTAAATAARVHSQAWATPAIPTTSSPSSGTPVPSDQAIGQPRLARPGATQTTGRVERRERTP